MTTSPFANQVGADSPAGYHFERIFRLAYQSHPPRYTHKQNT